MFAAQRRDRILHRLRENRQIIVKELAIEMNVSEGTLRTDLRLLEEEGLLERTHGGAVPVKSASNPSLQPAPSRSELNQKEKQAIGRQAAELVQRGQCILLDASSTVFELARCLSEMDYLTVVTNGLSAAEEIGRNPRNNVILIGGILRHGSRTVEGVLGRSILQEVHADLFFTSAEGFTLDTGMTDFSMYEAELKKLMAANASQVVALLDHTKLGRRSIVTSIQAQAIHTLITDSAADPLFLRTLGRMNVIQAT
ncbi:DeoR/GlpR family DNA-binding transcription regulator [Paenibacillus nasutitermitis]|uniref:DeoR family transcriptional regulator n=1 Tax=Paenibacillus nasutitermitis TaxID=1652958 RepID=A0A916ZDH9_9BACL|nr:DeoR/GlpR family DNA-binding transcription regulator [Paenibacillus nasutitermitis]GGD90054.1 DeoR family transcriptional regulator [Paenibacillus nasutitermitis]